METSESSPQPSPFAFSGGAATNCEQISTESSLAKSEAAVVVQKVYRSYRTRRQLADLAVMNKNYAWWNVLEGVLLQQRSEGFYAYKRQDTAASRWARLRKKAAKVGKGLSQDGNARKLAIQHWLEAIDPRHRYGHNLHFYYNVWEKSETKEPFFYWLDIGEGKDVDLPDCKRSKLQKQQIKYLGPVQSVSDDMLQKYPSGRICETSNAVITEELFVQGIGVYGSNLEMEVGEAGKSPGIAGEKVNGNVVAGEAAEGSTRAFGASENDREQGNGAFNFEVHVLERRSETKIDVTHAAPQGAERQVSLGDLADEEADIARLVLVPPESSEGTLGWASGAGPRLASLQGCPL